MHNAIETKIKTTVFAKKLRTRLAALKAKRAKDILKYKADFVAWKKSLAKWISVNSAARVDAITFKEVQSCTNRHHYGSDGQVTFRTGDFFRGSPVAPTYPGDQQIRDIQSLLRQLGISGVETIRLNAEYVNKFFADGDDSKDEE